jgi:hypothetical protein
MARNVGGTESQSRSPWVMMMAVDSRVGDRSEYPIISSDSCKVEPWPRFRSQRAGVVGDNDAGA